jgi:subtilisin family serine protease
LHEQCHTGRGAGSTGDAIAAIEFAVQANIAGVDLGAPGTNVLSTIIGRRYASFSGTSMATLAGITVTGGRLNVCKSDCRL